ncbi:unnamed protein product [Schistosoma curassoni]|nr:unnamed protein product [Schistosoma curassoni]
MKCIWCERAKTCIESNDQSTHQLKVNDCRVEEVPDVSDLSTPTLIKHIETTLATTEVQVNENLKETTEETDQHSNTTTHIIKENNRDNLLLYLFIVVLLHFFISVLRIGYVIWRWLCKKKKSEN